MIGARHTTQQCVSMCVLTMIMEVCSDMEFSRKRGHSGGGALGLLSLPRDLAVV